MDGLVWMAGASLGTRLTYAAGQGQPADRGQQQRGRADVQAQRRVLRGLWSVLLLLLRWANVPVLPHRAAVVPSVAVVRSFMSSLTLLMFFMWSVSFFCRARNVWIVVCCNRLVV